MRCVFKCLCFWSGLPRARTLKNQSPPPGPCLNVRTEPEPCFQGSCTSKHGIRSCIERGFGYGNRQSHRPMLVSADAGSSRGEFGRTAQSNTSISHRIVPCSTVTVGTWDDQGTEPFTCAHSGQGSAVMFEVRRAMELVAASVSSGLDVFSRPRQINAVYAKCPISPDPIVLI